ncbi:O-acetylhomoserine aminocarboxypropyltransferase/cysteine synthase family protein [Thermophilibacter immobilis]|uniref:O-succinylhomoserine sulfhydrylase n=1 Tax=Thermophilibacter immobilis TaxID=2779519 RepID=A0A7S7M8T7_9ACTN|nr:O-acetylhomoserine aminocarboxypropyltransferase/cysteine synthase family protein [Thermophilibacter immobilis]QOY60577.1 O-acetylhomoserine aminocarboxypropyltransferase/cysteine synthase [Thermophilibacter immobilis]
MAFQLDPTFSSDPEKHFDTLQVHAGLAPDPTTGAAALPIYASAAFQFDDAADAAGKFGLTRPGNVYGRLTNTTTDAVAARVAAIEGGTGAVAVASGHAAEILAITNIVGAGDEIVASDSLYGGTWNIFLHTLADLGVKTTFVENNDIDAFVAASNEHTKLWYVETIGNPLVDVADVPALVEAARSLNLPVFVDNTFATPYLYRPTEDGAAVVIESLTKWIGGHGATLGGAVIDAGTFAWGAVPGKFPTLTEPDPSYHGLVFAEAAAAAPFSTRVLANKLRDFGPTLSPYAAQLIGIGIETLSLRVQRHSDNALAVARFLEGHPKVSWVRYAGLENDPSHELAARLLRHGFGGVLVFGVKGGREAGLRVVERVRLFTHLANVGDAKSLIIHPASTTHSQLSAEQLREAHLSEDLVRLSVGIENVEDLIADLDQALARA